MTERSIKANEVYIFIVFCVFSGAKVEKKYEKVTECT
jgi:hypothetical protein